MHWTNENKSVKEFFDERGVSGIVNVSYISVWDNGFEAISNAKYDIDNNLAFDIEAASLYDDDGDEVQILLGQYIEIPTVGRFSIDEDSDEPIVFEITEIF